MDFAIDNVLIPLIKIGVVFGALSGVIAYLTLLERKRLEMARTITIAHPAGV